MLTRKKDFHSFHWAINKFTMRSYLWFETHVERTSLYLKTYLISGIDLMRRHTTSHCPARNSMAPIASLILFVIAVGPVINDVPLSTIAVHPFGQAYDKGSF